MPRCLIVDDSESMREIAADHLTAFGFKVAEAAGPSDAVTALRQAPGHYDLILLDWDLPALGALDVLRAAGEMEQRPEIVLCATEHDRQQLRLAAAAGARHHVLKPFDREALGATVTAACAGRAA